MLIRSVARKNKETRMNFDGVRTRARIGSTKKVLRAKSAERK